MKSHIPQVTTFCEFSEKELEIFPTLVAGTVFLLPRRFLCPGFECTVDMGWMAN